MPMLNPTTELEAVNLMLMSIGQAPVSTLEVTGIVDVNNAKMRLTEVTRRVCGMKFNWNTDEEYELSPDVDGVIAVPAGVLKIDPSDVTQNYVLRRHPTKNILALYNKDEKTFTFTDPVEVDIVWGFVFEDLPQAARDYIAVAAGRKFQANVVGSQILDKFEEDDEQRAWIELHKTALRSQDSNVFRSNPALSRFRNRRY